jgi:CelD/BcsL family acetyltransferase involved in cellulose biosynthesis
MNFAPRTPLRADAPALHVTVEREFAFAGAEYRALHRRSGASAFQAPRWLEALQRDVAPAFGATPVTVTARDPNGRLMLVLSLALQRRHGVTTLEFADFGLCDYLAAVHDPADLPLLLADATLAHRLAAALPRHDVLALTKLSGEHKLLAHLFPSARRARMRISAYPARLRPDWIAWRTECLNAGVRRELDMKRRRLNRAGDAEFTTLRDAAAIAEAFEALRRYRSARFKAIGAPDVMDHEAVFAFYRRMAIDGAREGWARTECLSLSGEPIAVQFGLAQDGTYSMLLIGLDIARHARLSPGLLAIEDSIRSAIGAGDRVYDFTIGDHPYKLQFGGETVPLHEWHCARTLVREAKRTLKPLLKRSAPVRAKEPAG